MSIEHLIAPVNDRLTPTERRVAEAVTEDPSLLAFGTVSDLAGRVGTSPPSIVRFAVKLGFHGFRELQHEVRSGLSEHLLRPSARIRRPQDAVPPVRHAIVEAIEAVFDALEGEQLAAVAGPIAAARNVWVLSGETSRAGAHTLVSGLSMLRPHVALVADHSTGRDLSSAGPDDVVVVFDFERYRRNPLTAATTLAGLGVTLVAITDGPLSPLASLTPTWCGLTIPAVGPFDSSAPAVLAAELIVAHVATELGAHARDRIDQLETFWEATGTFLRERPAADETG